MSDAPIRVLLGPQNPVRNIASAVTELPEGPVAVVSAAWQEAEGDLDELRGVTGRDLEDTGLYGRVEKIFRDDPELADAYRLRQDRLQEQHQLYRIRLRSMAVAVRRLHRIEGDDDILRAERRHAFKQLRALDRHHLKHGDVLHEEFASSIGLAGRDSVLRQAEAVRKVLDDCVGVVVTGGNVAVLINRLQLLGLADDLAPRNIVGWSAGAMALTQRIVLFHERMAHGRRDPEIFGRGLGVVKGIVALPDAGHRLRKEDRLRHEMMARRFSPDACVTLDNDTYVRLDGDRLAAAEGARRLGKGGRLGKLRVA